MGILQKYQQHKMIKVILLAGIVITIILFFFIPYITEQYTIKTITASSKNSVHQVKLTRAYYVNAIVNDIKKYAPNIRFSHDHEGVNGIIPLPTTTIHDLSKIFSEKTGLKYNLYSEYPFKNRKDRNLTQFQKDAIKYTKINEDGLYVKREVMNGEEVLRVATTDYMTDMSCVNCHNNHPDATWEKGKWKLNDKRGVLEVVTPIGKQLANHNNMRNYILLLLVTTFVVLLFYLSKVVIKRERALLDERDILEEEVDDKNKELHNLNILLDEHVISSKTDLKGNLTYVSQAFIDICGYTKDELLKHPYDNIRHPDMSKDILNEIWRTIYKGKTWNGEILNQKKDGTAYWVDAIFSPEYDESGTLMGHYGLIHDITLIKETDYLAYHDYLTKLPNRAYFEEVLTHAIKLAKRNNSMVSVLFLDLDNFKIINDTHGHEFGDEVLKVLSTRMSEVLKDIDTIARIGGDEFIILLEDVKNKASILDLVHQILQVISKAIKMHSQTVQLTSSIGIANYPEDGITVQDLMKYADDAMYHAKNSGKNTFKFYTKDISQAMKRRIEIEKALRFAVDNDGFTLVYQPKYNLKTHEVIGCEALLRLDDDALGALSPSEFVPIAEENRLIIPIGEWVLENACKALKSFQVMGLPLETISVNISSIQLQEEDIVNRITHIVDTSQLKPHNIDLELTEYSVMYQTEKSIDILGHLRAKGFQISIDDFGTGYSSMSYLQKLPIDTIKIDKIFIDELALDIEDISITKAIIALAQGLGYKVLAEGIEEKIQEDILLEYHCMYGQGYLFSKPLPFNDFVSFVREKCNTDDGNMFYI